MKKNASQPRKPRSYSMYVLNPRKRPTLSLSRWVSLHNAQAQLRATSILAKWNSLTCGARRAATTTSSHQSPVSCSDTLDGVVAFSPSLSIRIEVRVSRIGVLPLDAAISEIARHHLEIDARRDVDGQISRVHTLVGGSECDHPVKYGLRFGRLIDSALQRYAYRAVTGFLNHT